MRCATSTRRVAVRSKYRCARDVTLRLRWTYGATPLHGRPTLRVSAGGGAIATTDAALHIFFSMEVFQTSGGPGRPIASILRDCIQWRGPARHGRHAPADRSATCSESVLDDAVNEYSMLYVMDLAGSEKTQHPPDPRRSLR